jgi:hypothetical protein
MHLLTHADVLANIRDSYLDCRRISNRNWNYATKSNAAGQTPNRNATGHESAPEKANMCAIVVSV